MNVNNKLDHQIFPNGSLCNRCFIKCCIPFIAIFVYLELSIKGQSKAMNIAPFPSSAMMLNGTSNDYQWSHGL